MIAPELLTTNNDIRLIEPDLQRDPELSVEWLEGEEGRRTLQAIGVLDKDIQEPTLEGEEERIRSLIEAPDKIVWMIEWSGEVVGSVIVILRPTKYLDAPALRIMIGDATVRGNGIATAALRSVIDWLHSERPETFVYTRYRTNNKAASQLLLKVGFEQDSDPYIDKDGLEWQNVILRDEL